MPAAPMELEVTSDSSKEASTQPPACGLPTVEGNSLTAARPSLKENPQGTHPVPFLPGTLLVHREHLHRAMT